MHWFFKKEKKKKKKWIHLFERSSLQLMSILLNDEDKESR